MEVTSGLEKMADKIIANGVNVLGQNNSFTSWVNQFLDDIRRADDSSEMQIYARLLLSTLVADDMPLQHADVGPCLEKASIALRTGRACDLQNCAENLMFIRSRYGRRTGLLHAIKSLLTFS